VIPLPREDPALGADLDVVLSDSAMSEVLGRHLPDCASGAFHVKTCRLSWVSYKPGRSCVARYELTLRDTETGSTVRTLAKVIRMSRARRAEKLWADPALSRLVERAARLHPDPPVGRAAYVPQMQAIVQLYPVDTALPALVYAVSSSEMRRVLRETLPEGIGSALRECHAELVRYKSKRATLRYRLRGAGVDTVYGKLRPDERGAMRFEVGRALREAGVPTPAPLAYLPDLRMLVHAEAPGTLLAELRGKRPEFEAWLVPVAEVLAHLHATRVAGLPGHSPRHGAEGVLAAARAIGTALPDLAAEVDRLATSLAADLTAVVGPETTIHGDFSDNQVLVSDAGVALLDLDEVRLDNPLFDVGTFLARLQARPMQPPGAADDARAIFLDAYVALRPDAREHIPLFEAAALIRRWAAYPLRRLRPGWSDETERLVRLASQRLQEYRRRGRSTMVRF
jgi:Ser/Thr protein kinase RdoA (MazF antagonist)